MPQIGLQMLSFLGKKKELNPSHLNHKGREWNFEETFHC